nr:hypothetical protein [Tanacetum cinerariifolium]
MTIGSIGEFLDVLFNFNTQALLEDNIIARKLYIVSTLEFSAISFEIIHYLGLDHVGHLGGRSSTLMGPKLQEMDEVIKTIHKSAIHSQESDHRKTLLRSPATEGTGTEFLAVAKKSKNDIRRHGKNVTAIDNYKIAHYCEKKKRMVSEEAAAVLEKQEYETRLAKIYYQKVHLVHVLDFARLCEINEGDVELDMTERLRMEHKGADGEVLFTYSIWRELLAIHGPLRAFEEAVSSFDFFYYFWQRVLDRVSWVAKGPSRQQVRAADRDAQIDHERVEEEVQRMSVSLSKQHVMIHGWMSKHARYSAWMGDRIIELIESRDMRYERFDSTTAPDTHLHFELCRVRQRTDGASTSAQQT